MSAQANLTELVEFLSSAMTNLDARPQSLEEIRKQQAEGVALYEQRPRMAEILRQVSSRDDRVELTGTHQTRQSSTHVACMALSVGWWADLTGFCDRPRKRRACCGRWAAALR